jgi:hypothetical protein
MKICRARAAAGVYFPGDTASADLLGVCFDHNSSKTFDIEKVL